jgi:hypothetical protein
MVNFTDSIEILKRRADRWFWITILKAESRDELLDQSTDIISYPCISTMRYTLNCLGIVIPDNHDLLNMRFQDIEEGNIATYTVAKILIHRHYSEDVRRIADEEPSVCQNRVRSIINQLYR